MIAASIETKPEFRVTGSEVLFEGRYTTGWDRNYDISLDGQRFLVLQPEYDDSEVLNWFEELKRLVPTGKDL